jgi:hypothetical protein
VLTVGHGLPSRARPRSTEIVWRLRSQQCAHRCHSKLGGNSAKRFKGPVQGKSSKCESVGFEGLGSSVGLQMHPAEADRSF